MAADHQQLSCNIISFLSSFYRLYGMSIATFMTLPSDVHVIIITHLDFPATAHLKHTSHYFDNLVKNIDIYQAENSTYAKVHKLWACRECASLRPSFEFSDKNKRAKRAKAGAEASKRFCIPCGVKGRCGGRSLYSPGDRIVLGGKVYFVCTACPLSTKGPNDTQKGLCKNCIQDARLLRIFLSAATAASESPRAVDSTDRCKNESNFHDFQETIKAARLEAETLKEKILLIKAELRPGRFQG